MPTHALRWILASGLCLATACGGGGSPSATGDTTTPEPQPAPQPVAETEPSDEGGDVDPIPQGLHTVTPHLVVPDIEEAVAFYVEALGAEKRNVMAGPDGEPMHGEITIGDSVVMLSPQNEQWETKAPEKAGGTCGGLLVYVEDVDTAYDEAVEAGANKVMPVDDMFWGDRYGQLEDPYGHRWSLATHQYDIADEEMKERAQAWAEAMASGEQPPEFEGGEEADSFKPEDYFTVTPSLVVTGPDVLDFYEDAFGAERRDVMITPDGKLMHAEMTIGDSIVMLTGEHPEQDEHMRAPKSLEAAPFSLMIYVEDADATFAKAVEAGGERGMPVTDMFWGDRMGEVTGPAGHGWAIGTHVEDLSPEQMQQRMREQMAEQTEGGEGDEGGEGGEGDEGDEGDEQDEGAEDDAEAAAAEPEKSK